MAGSRIHTLVHFVLFADTAEFEAGEEEVEVGEGVGVEGNLFGDEFETVLLGTWHEHGEVDDWKLFYLALLVGEAFVA